MDCIQLICKNFEAYKTHEDKTLSVGEWLTVIQDMINAFAGATLDFQWMLVDLEHIKEKSPAIVL